MLKLGPPFADDGRKVGLVAKGIRIDLVASRIGEDRDHILDYGVVTAPHGRQIKTPALARVPPGQQEIGAPAALTGVTLCMFNQAPNGSNFNLRQFVHDLPLLLPCAGGRPVAGAARARCS